MLGTEYASLAGRPHAVEIPHSLNFITASSVTVNIHLYNTIFLSSHVILAILHSCTNSDGV